MKPDILILYLHRKKLTGGFLIKKKTYSHKIIRNIDAHPRKIKTLRGLAMEKEVIQKSN